MEWCLTIDELNNKQEFTIAISPLCKDIFHLGFFHKTESKSGIIHLMGHMDLRDSNHFHKYKFIRLECLDEDEIIHLIAAIRAAFIACNNSIPFGPCGGGSFAESGEYQGVAGDGLTCSLLVLAFLESHGFKLINKETWPIRETDSTMQLDIINDLSCDFSRDPDDLEHFKIQKEKAESGTPRYRPEEVGASAIFEDIPIDFSCIDENSILLKNHLIEHLTTQ